VPTWRAEYFDRTNGQSPGQSIIIAAENEAVALEEVRARMAPTCSRAEVTQSIPTSKSRFSTNSQARASRSELIQILHPGTRATAWHQGEASSGDTPAGAPRAPAIEPRSLPSNCWTVKQIHSRARQSTWRSKAILPRFDFALNADFAES
jgi:hypothetical protein